MSVRLDRLQLLLARTMAAGRTDMGSRRDRRGWGPGVGLSPCLLRLSLSTPSLPLYSVSSSQVVRVVEGLYTATYTALLGFRGESQLGVGDMEIHRGITPTTHSS